MSDNIESGAVPVSSAKITAGFNCMLFTTFTTSLLVSGENTGKLIKGASIAKIAVSSRYPLFKLKYVSRFISKTYMPYKSIIPTDTFTK